MSDGSGSKGLIPQLSPVFCATGQDYVQLQPAWMGDSGPKSLVNLGDVDLINTGYGEFMGHEPSHITRIKLKSSTQSLPLLLSELRLCLQHLLKLSGEAKLQNKER